MARERKSKEPSKFVTVATKILREEVPVMDKIARKNGFKNRSKFLLGLYLDAKNRTVLESL